MKSHTQARFWQFYARLPEDVQQHADKAYQLWQSNPHFSHLPRGLAIVRPADVCVREACKLAQQVNR